MLISQPAHFKLRKHFEKWLNETGFYQKFHFYNLGITSVYGPKAVTKNMGYDLLVLLFWVLWKIFFTIS